ncbi:gluconate transporter [Caldalkalibacillus thermarum]|nr:gluconate transporter [Caldalkalibacillus thermarum]
MEGFGLVLTLIVAVLFIVIATAKLKIHPFLALLMATFGFGVFAGLPLNELVQAVTDGFGGLMGSIGIVIVTGTIIGTILEKSGAAFRMAEVILRLIGSKRPQLAMSMIGGIVSIPVFCDSGYVILSSLKKSLAKRAKVALASMAVALATGLYATHTLVPPTPGPVAAAGNIGAEHILGTIMIIGLIVAIPVIVVGYLWAVKVASKIEINPQHDELDYHEIIKSYGPLPSTTKAFLPIVLPIVLIALGTIVNFMGWTGTAADVFRFVGSPVVALLIGVLSSFILLPSWTEETINGWVGEAIKHAAPILLITGAGGAFGSVIRATAITDLIEGLATVTAWAGPLVLLIPFFIAAALKTAQGSSTAAMVITSALVAPLLTSFNIVDPIPLALVVMAIGAGAMTVSHVNDSYFWIVKEFSGMTVTDAYKAQTMATLVQGVTAILVTMLLWWILV